MPQRLVSIAACLPLAVAECVAMPRLTALGSTIDEAGYGDLHTIRVDADDCATLHHVRDRR